MYPLQVKPLAQMRIKLNRELGRKNSVEAAASDRTAPGPEKTTPPTDRSATATASGGERPTKAAEGGGRRARSTSRERGGSRERPSSAGERPPGSERGRDRASGSDRERDRTSGLDRDRERASGGSDKERDGVSGLGLERVAVTVERGAAEGERSVRTDRNASGGAGGGRSVSLDRMTIGERSAIARRPEEQQDKPGLALKDRGGEGSERAARLHRSATLVSLLLV